MIKVLLVGLGGFTGSITRYLLALAMYEYVAAPTFPYATLVINALGCFAIGVFNGLAETGGLFSAETRVLVVVGFLGGFTTFSAFGNETFVLMRGDQWLAASSNIALHLIIGIAAVWAGYALANAIAK